MSMESPDEIAAPKPEAAYAPEKLTNLAEQADALLQKLSSDLKMALGAFDSAGAPEATPPEVPLAATERMPFDFSKMDSMNVDPLFVDEVFAVLQRGRASAVVLQRALNVGYAQDLKILDQMTEAGILGPDKPGGAREILLPKEEWERRFSEV